MAKKDTAYTYKRTQSEQHHSAIRNILHNSQKKDIIVREARSARLQLLLQPSLLDKLKAAAFEQNLSVNSYINNCLCEKIGHEEDQQQSRKE